MSEIHQNHRCNCHDETQKKINELIEYLKTSQKKHETTQNDFLTKLIKLNENYNDIVDTIEKKSTYNQKTINEIKEKSDEIQNKIKFYFNKISEQISKQMQNQMINDTSNVINDLKEDKKDIENSLNDIFYDNKNQTKTSNVIDEFKKFKTINHKNFNFLEKVSKLKDINIILGQKKQIQKTY